MHALFGGLISIMLLGIYLHLIIFAFQVVQCITTNGCSEYTRADFNDGMAQALALVGGLVSALVIAELATTKPGSAPAGLVFSANASERQRFIFKSVTVLYILVWITAGLVAFFVGLYHPDALPPLTTLGQAWLGLAVASAYAYFGIKP